MSQPAEYVLSEGILLLPETAQDHSVTIVKLLKSRATLVITRAWDVRPGDEQAYIDQQLVKVKRDMKNFAGDEPQESRFGPLHAREIAMRFETQGVKVAQRLLVVRLESHLLALTFSCSGGFDAEALAVWDDIRQGFIPTTAPGGPGDGG